MSNAPRLRPVRSAVIPAVRPATIQPPILDWHYKTGLRDYASGSPFSFGRAGQAVQTLDDGSQILTGNNWARNEARGLLLEGAHRNYFQRDFTVTAGRISHAAAPASQTITIAATGSHVVWVRGAASVAVAAGTATGTGWGTATQASPLVLNITATGTITLTITGASTADIVQVQDGPVPLSYVPNPVGTQYTVSASEGADTSGNGLSIPLSRSMRDSLTGEASDWTAAWSHVSGTAPTYSGGNKILTYSAQTSSDYHALLPAGVSVGDEIEVNYSISGLTGGTFQLGFGSGSTGEARSANGAYIERGTLTTNTNLYTLADALTGTVTINYVRRVLESGQTNPGEGTIIQWVDLPWDYSVLIPGAVHLMTAGSGPQFYFNTVAGPTNRLFLYDGVTICRLEPANLLAGRYALVQQFSATLGRMRVGLYNPTTDVLTWSSPTLAGGAPYRGFFPIHSSNLLRFFYGGGPFPIYARALRWLPGITSDFETIYHAKELSI